MTIQSHTDWAEVERRACEFERSRIAQTREVYANRAELYRLKFERAMERFDIDQANTACAQREYCLRMANHETKTPNTPKN